MTADAVPTRGLGAKLIDLVSWLADSATVNTEFYLSTLMAQVGRGRLTRTKSDDVHLIMYRLTRLHFSTEDAYLTIHD